MGLQNKRGRVLGINAMYILLAGVGVFIVLHGNPADSFFDAGNSAYYQARVAYARGSHADKAAIEAVFVDRKISIREYSDTVFPAFLRTVKDGEETLPQAEQKRSVDDLRAHLAQVLAGGYE